MPHETVRFPEAHYEALFEHSPQGMARIDLAGTILDVNPALVRRSGFAREMLLNHHIAEFLAPDLEPLGAELLAALRRGESAGREVELVHRTGRSLARRFIIVPVFDGADVSGGFVVITDITAQVEAQQRMRSLFEHHPHGIGSVDETGRVLDVNAALVRMSGYAREELLGANFLDFAGPDTREVAQALLANTLAGEAQTQNLSPYRKDGSRGYVQCTTIPVRVEGGIRGAYIVFEDIEERQHQAALLRESEERFRSLFAQNPDAVLALDRAGIILDVNDALLHVNGLTRDQLLGQDFRRFVSESELARVEPYLHRVLDGEAAHYDFEYRNFSGREMLFEVTAFPMIAGGEVMGSYVVLVDVTAQREATRRAEAQERRIRELYHVAATSSVAESQITATLAAGCRLLRLEVGAIVDCTRDPHVEQRFDAVAHEALHDSEALVALAVEAVSANGPVVLTAEQQAASRHYRFAISVPLVVAGQPYGTVCFASTQDDGRHFEQTDVDLVALISALLGSALERRRSRANLKTLAYFDSLTGLPNRVYVQERLRDAIEDAQSSMRRVALVFFDLDRFKDVNDTLGHALGDRLLQLVAGRLIETVRDRGTVARMGGDEFAVLLTGCESTDDVRATVERLLTAIDAPFQLDEYEQFVTASAGISIYPDDGKDDQTLIKNADIAMYRAKDLGRNAFQFYAPSLEATIQMRLSQEKLLRRALENEEFVVYYQPQVDVLSGRIVALEALVRWNNPKTGIIFPGRFIPSAEMSGLIVPLGHWVLEAAAAQTALWRKRYAHLRVAVNLSAKQFHQPDLRARILNAAGAAGLPPEALEIEITESVAMTDAANSVQIMRDLVDAGIRIGLDDFGTGYSSLTYLRRFPAAVLKIDRSFVAGIGVEGNDETIVITVIAMAHNLGLEVVAEGVETAQQYEFLRNYGCDRVQGYYISPAVPVSGIDELLSEWRALEA